MQRHVVLLVAAAGQVLLACAEELNDQALMSQAPPLVAVTRDADPRPPMAPPPRPTPESAPDPARDPSAKREHAVAPTDPALAAIYGTFLYTGHRGNGAGGVYHFNANIPAAATRTFREALYVIGRGLDRNTLTFADAEAKKAGRYGFGCDPQVVVRYTGPELSPFALVSTEDRRDLDDRFYRREPVDEPLPAAIREAIGGASGFGFDWSADTRAACADRPIESRTRFSREADSFEYYQADCTKWGEAASFGVLFPVFHRTRSDGSVEILCRGEACGGGLASDSDLHFAADLDADGSPEVTLQPMNGTTAVHELGDPSSHVVDMFTWEEGYEHPCHDGRADDLLLAPAELESRRRAPPTAAFPPRRRS